MEFGAFVEIFPGTTARAHLGSRQHAVKKVEDVLKEATSVVKVVSVDRSGRSGCAQGSAGGQAADGSPAASVRRRTLCRCERARSA